MHPSDRGQNLNRKEQDGYRMYANWNNGSPTYTYRQKKSGKQSAQSAQSERTSMTHRRNGAEKISQINDRLTPLGGMKKAIMQRLIADKSGRK